MAALALLLVVSIIVILIVVLVRISEMAGRVRNLEDRLSRVVREFNELKPTTEATEPVVESARAEAPRTLSEPSLPPAPIIAGQPMLPPELAPAPAPLFVPPPTPPSRTREEWEALIGGKLLNRIGALALVIGVGFFLKYAFDNNWLSETVRVLIGAVAGFLLLAGASRSRTRGLMIFAQGLVGAGIAVLYLSVYASFNYYSLVSQPVAFVLMAAVTIIAFTQAFRYDSIAVSLLGWAGGFLTPFMLSTGEANEIGLFSYIALLAAGMLVVVMKKEKWAILEPLTLAATYVIYFLWYGQEYKPDSFALTLFFAVLFWALFFIVDLVNSFRRVNVLEELRNVSAGFNAGLFYLALFLLINGDHHAWMGGTTVALGAVYFLTALAIRRASPDAGSSFVRLIFTAVVLLVLAPAIEYERFTIIIIWAVQAFVLAWCGRRWDFRFATISALVLYTLTTWSLLATEGALFQRPAESFTLLLNMRSAAFALLAASMAASGFLVAKEPPASNGPSKATPGIATVLHYAWGFLLFLLFTVETNDLFRKFMSGPGADQEALSFQRYMTEALVWAFLAIAFGWGARQRKLSPLLYSGIVVMFLAMGMVAIRGIAFAPVEQFALLANYRALAMVGVIGAAFVMTSVLGTMKEVEWSRESADAIGVFAVVLILVLLTGETRDFFEKRLSLLTGSGSGTTDSKTALENMKQLSLSGVWLLYSISLMAIGIWRHRQSLRISSIILFGITILKIFVYDLSFLETLYRIFSFIGLGAVLLVVSYLYQHFKDVIFQERPKEAAKREEIPA